MAQYDLKRLRRDKGLTQQELAKRLNISQGFLSSVESGRNPFPDERVDDLQSLFPDLILENYEGNIISKEAKMEMGSHNTDSDIRINDPDSFSSLITFLKDAVKGTEKEKQEELGELEAMRSRNEKLTERYDRIVDELEDARKKLFEAREEIWQLRSLLAEHGIKETRETIK